MIWLLCNVGIFFLCASMAFFSASHAPFRFPKFATTTTMFLDSPSVANFQLSCISPNSPNVTTTATGGKSVWIFGSKSRRHLKCQQSVVPAFAYQKLFFGGEGGVFPHVNFERIALHIPTKTGWSRRRRGRQTKTPDQTKTVQLTKKSTDPHHNRLCSLLFHREYPSLVQTTISCFFLFFHDSCGVFLKEMGMVHYLQYGAILMSVARDLLPLLSFWSTPEYDRARLARVIWTCEGHQAFPISKFLFAVPISYKKNSLEASLLLPWHTHLNKGGFFLKGRLLTPPPLPSFPLRHIPESKIRWEASLHLLLFLLPPTWVLPQGETPFSTWSSSPIFHIFISHIFLPFFFSHTQVLVARFAIRKTWKGTPSFSSSSENMWLFLCVLPISSGSAQKYSRTPTSVSSLTACYKIGRADLVKKFGTLLRT